jgi:apoptosis-inducing factor 2
MTKRVVVLGGSHSCIVAVKEIAKIDRTAEITVISPSTHFFFNVSAPRAFVDPTYPSQLFFPLKSIFAKEIEQSQVTLVQGKAVRTDFQGSHLLYASQGKESIQEYDILVLATGARAESKAFKVQDNHNDTLKAIEEIAAKAKTAKQIVVAGGGATGVETASEFKEKYPNAEVILYTGSEGPLKHLNKIDAATKKLSSLGVKVVNQIKVTSNEKISDGRVRLSLSNGQTQIVDVYVPAIGLYPNSGYIDSACLDQDGYVVTHNTLVVKGTENVIAVGDIVSGTSNSVATIQFDQRPVLTSTLRHLLTGSKITKTYNGPIAATQMVPTGSKGGVGLVFGWSVPSFLVAQLKGKDFMLARAKKDYSA